MSDAKAEDFERLASRMALLVAENGEADAAGRAVGSLARKLGLTGGHLKAIFLAGAGRLNAVAKQAEEHSERASRAEDMAHGLQHSLDQIDYALIQAQRESDRLRQENARLREALERTRSGRRVTTILLLLATLLVGAGVAFVELAPSVLPHRAPSPVEVARGAGGYVRKTGADLHARPDPASPILVHLEPGQRVPVKIMVWHDFVQWAELHLGDRVGYVMATDLDLD